MSPRRLVVNVDHVATLRQARLGKEPEPVAAATLALLGGADGIVVHLREDRRHIQDRDVRLLREIVHSHFCLEMAATFEMLKIALEVRPDSVTLVPERREELTTEGGLDLLGGGAEQVEQIVADLNANGLRSCLFVDPERAQLDAAAQISARAVELHTGRYALEAPGSTREIGRIYEGVRHAASLPLEIGVGHGLDYGNVAALAEVEEIVEYSIGHAIVSRALLVGMEQAVMEMRQRVV